MKSFLMSAIRPPKALSTPGTRGTTTSRIPSSRARKQAIIGPAPPKAISDSSRGSLPWRDTSFETSRYMPDTATRMIDSAVSSSSLPIFAATVAIAVRDRSARIGTAL